MVDELNAMEANNTWFVVSLPQGQHSIGCKWVYKVKHKSMDQLNATKFG